MQILIRNGDLRKDLQSLLEHQDNVARKNHILIRNVGVTEVEVGHIGSRTTEAYIEIRHGHEDVRREDGPSILIRPLYEDPVVFQDDSLLDGQAYVGDVCTDVLRASGRITRAGRRVIYAMQPTPSSDAYVAARGLMSVVTAMTSVITTSVTVIITATMTSSLITMTLITSMTSAYNKGNQQQHNEDYPLHI